MRRVAEAQMVQSRKRGAIAIEGIIVFPEFLFIFKGILDFGNRILPFRVCRPAILPYGIPKAGAIFPHFAFTCEIFRKFRVKHVIVI